MDQRFKLTTFQPNLSSNHILRPTYFSLPLEPPQIGSDYSPSIYNYSNYDETTTDGILSSSKKIYKNMRREKYQIIPNEVRLQLIDAITNKGQRMKQAALRLGINYSSAKSIYQIYKKEGRLQKKGSKSCQIMLKTEPQESNPSCPFDSAEDTLSFNSTPKRGRILVDFNSCDSKPLAADSPVSSNSTNASAQKSLKNNQEEAQSHSVTSGLANNEEALTALFTKVQNQISNNQMSALMCLMENNKALYQTMSSQISELLVSNWNQKLQLTRERQNQIALLRTILSNSPNLPTFFSQPRFL